MGNYRWISRRLKSINSMQSILEPGAGDGSLAKYLRGKNPSIRKAAYTGLDIVEIPADWPSGWNWIQKDLLDYSFSGNHQLVIANLILHHFKDHELMLIGGRMQASSCEVLLLNEPVRRRLHLWQVSLSRLLGVHRVTLHDARVSIHAGFRGKELAQLLGLKEKYWTIQSQDTFMGANRLICRRRT